MGIMEQRKTQPIDVLPHVEAFLATSGMAKTSFGTEAAGDPNLVDDLRNGREPRRKTRERIMRFIAQAVQA